MRRQSDPLESLDGNLMLAILQKLEAQDLATCLTVSRAWRQCALDDSLWEKFCDGLCKGKAGLSPLAASTSTSKVHFYNRLLQESSRTSISVDELCGFSWNFRFKEIAGPYWMCRDPYWSGLPWMKRIFHEDGFISAGWEDLVWGGHECSWTMKDGSVRINSWPPLLISRTPTWGWQMENQLFLYHAQDKRQQQTSLPPDSKFVEADPSRGVDQLWSPNFVISI